MSDLTNQINELFDGPSEPKQEPIVEQVVEPVKEEVRPRAYRKLEKPKIRREKKKRRQSQFNPDELQPLVDDEEQKTSSKQIEIEIPNKSNYFF